MQGSQTNIIGSLILGVSLPKMRDLILDNEHSLLIFFIVIIFKNLIFQFPIVS